MPHEHGAHDRILVEVVLILMQNADALSLSVRNHAARGFYLAREHLQKGGFARAVGADDAVAIPLGEFEVDVLKEFSAAELQR